MTIRGLASRILSAAVRRASPSMQEWGNAMLAEIPKGPRDFFLKVVDAQITFEVDAQGKATSLTLHQGGMNRPAKRME